MLAVKHNNPDAITDPSLPKRPFHLRSRARMEKPKNDEQQLIPLCTLAALATSVRRRKRLANGGVRLRDPPSPRSAKAAAEVVEAEARVCEMPQKRKEKTRIVGMLCTRRTLRLARLLVLLESYFFADRECRSNSWACPGSCSRQYCAPRSHPPPLRIPSKVTALSAALKPPLL